MNMLEGVLAAPLHFTIEFCGFVVAVGGAISIAFGSSPIRQRGIGRVTGGLGFALLAVASVVHGASFIEAEGDAPLIALRAIGLVFVALAVAASPAPPASYALLASQQALLYAPAGGALVLAVVSLMRSRFTGGATLRRLAAASLLYAVSEFIVAGAPRATVLTAAAPLYAAHGVRLLGHVALAWWLMPTIGSSVRSRFVAAFAALLIVVVLALSTTLSAVITDNIEKQELGRIRSQLSSALEGLQDEKQTLGHLAQEFSEAADVRAVMAEGRPLDGLARSTVAAGIPPVDFVVVATRQDRVGYATAGAAQTIRLADARVDSVLASDVTTQAIRGLGRVAVSIDELDGDHVAVVAAAEIPAPSEGGRVGVVAIGRYLDELFVDEVSAEADPAAVSLLNGNRVVASTLPSQARDALSAPANPGGAIATREQKLAGAPFFTASAILPAESGAPALILAAPAEIISRTQQDLTRNLFLIAVAVGTVALALAWLSGRAVTRPIQSLTATAQAVREGDLSVRATVAGRDEVGQLGETFNEMTEALTGLTDDLRAAAHEEQTLRSRIETIIQSMADGLIAVDASRRILAFNTEAELLTGIDSSLALGCNVGEVVDVRDARGERVQLPIEQLEEGSVRDVYVSRRHGAPVPIAVTTAALRDESGRVTGGVAVLRDMSREHELEKMKGEFLANISHELRTPLTPIKGYAEILAMGVPPEKSTVFGRGILDSTQRLERIVGLLIDYSALEAGRLAPRTASVDLAALAALLAEEWSKKAPAHNVMCSVASKVPLVTGDERLLRRTLDEVIGNAVKFSPDGGPIRIDVRGTDSATPGVEIIVSDRGIGISPDDVPRIFYDFQQIDGSETRTYSGLGLGLAFVRRIVAAHNGDVSVESVPDRGTKLTISIPASGAAPSASAG